MNTGLLIVIGLIIVFSAYLGFSIARYRKALTNIDKQEQSQYLVHLTDKNFSQVISHGITIVDFWAAWCKPCVFLAPIINELADNYGKQVKVAKMDVEANKRVPDKLGIRSIPTVIIFRDGKEVQRFIGVKPYNVYKKALEHLLNQKS